jgi:hypothetical protein
MVKLKSEAEMISIGSIGFSFALSFHYFHNGRYLELDDES